MSSLWTPNQFGSARLLRYYRSAEGNLLDAGSSPITVNNTNIATWTDISGNNQNATQSTDALRPRYLTNVVNGLPSVGDPTGVRGTGLLTTINVPTQYVAWWVGRVRAHANFGHLFGTETSPGFGVQMGTVNQLAVSTENIAYTAFSSAYTANTWAIIMLIRTVASGTATATLFVNGTQIGAPSGAAGTSGGSGGSVSIAVNGRANDLSNSAEDDCVEWGFVTGTITTAERQLIEGAALWRINEAGGLPFGHPYLSAPPTSGRPRTTMFVSTTG